MEIFISIIILAVSFAFIFIGGDWFTSSAIGIAKKLKIPTPIVGATLVSIGTTLPELLVTIFSIISKSSDMAVGNALGSVVFNCAIIGGILICFTTASLKSGGHFDYLLLIFSVVAIAVYSAGGKIGIIASLFLILLFVLFVIFNVLKAKQEQMIELEKPNNKPLYFYILLFLLSCAMLGVGAYFMVEKAKFFARLAGFSEMVIGLTIVAFGTSLPELVTTISAIRKKEPGLGLGNIVGSSIINATLLIGLTGVCSGAVQIENLTKFVTLPVAVLTTVVLIVPTLIKKKTLKWQSIFLLALYAVYYAFLILNAVGVLHI